MSEHDCIKKKTSKLGSLIRSWENSDRSCSQKLSSGTKLSSTRKLCNYLNTWFKWRVCMAVSIVNRGKRVILFRGNCHASKSSYLILSFFVMHPFVSNALTQRRCIKFTYSWCRSTLCSYGYDWISHQIVFRTVSCIPASNTHVKCDILNSISPLSDGKLRAVHRAKTLLFFFFPRVHLTVIIFHPITQFSTVACTQQLTRCNSYTNVSHFSAYCVDITNCTPEGCCCRNDGTRAGIDKVAWTNNPPLLSHHEEARHPPTCTECPTVWCSDIRGNLIRSCLTCA